MIYVSDERERPFAASDGNKPSDFSAAWYKYYVRISNEARKEIIQFKQNYLREQELKIIHKSGKQKETRNYDQQQLTFLAEATLPSLKYLENTW